MNRRLLSALGISLLALIVTGTWLVRRPGSGTSSYARGPHRVLFIGLDGADWELLDDYVQQGSMPHLASLLREGRSGILTTIHPPLSPIVWTTMITGMGPLEHGVLDFTRFRPGTGVREPITSDERRVPAIWNMASDAGRTVAVVGLWATWPAEPVRGLMVSDRLFSFQYDEPNPPERVVSPAAREPQAIAARKESEREVDFRAIKAFLPWLEEGEYDALVARGDPYAHPVTALRRMLIETKVYHGLATEWLREQRPDLAIVYFQGTDAIGHVFGPFAPPRQEGIPEGDFRRYQRVPELYFAVIDGLLGEYQSLARESGATLMIASDHGFRWKEDRPRTITSFVAATAGKWHRDDGVYVLWGPGIGDGASAPGPEAGDGGSDGMKGGLESRRTGGAEASRQRERGKGAGPAVPTGREPHPVATLHSGTPAGVGQVCATLLALLGLPPGKGLIGPTIDGLSAGPGAAVDYGASFRAGRSPSARSAAGPAEAPRIHGPAMKDSRPGESLEPGGKSGAGSGEEDLEKLRALGYVGGGESAAAPRTLADSPEGTRTAGSWNNEGLLLREQGRSEAAVAAFEKAIVIDPHNPSAPWNLSDLLAQLGSDPARSDALLLRALRDGLADGARIIAGRAVVLSKSGDGARALSLLDGAIALQPSENDLRVSRGRCRIAAGDCRGALEDFREALRLRAKSAELWAASGLARMCLGDQAGAEADFGRSLALDPNQPELQRALARGRP